MTKTQVEELMTRIDCDDRYYYTALVVLVDRKGNHIAHETEHFNSYTDCTDWFACFHQDTQEQHELLNQVETDENDKPLGLENYIIFNDLGKYEWHSWSEVKEFCKVKEFRL